MADCRGTSYNFSDGHRMVLGAIHGDVMIPSQGEDDFVVTLAVSSLRATMRWFGRNYRRYALRFRRFVVHRLLHADDPPHKLALGFAIGVFVTLSPTWGIQMVLVVFLAWLLRANKAVGVPLVWLTNPATTVPIYYPMYVVGQELLGSEPVGWEWWAELAKPPMQGGSWETLSFYWDKTLEIAAPLWLGCLVVGTIAAVLSYTGVYYLVLTYRLRRWGQAIPPDTTRVRRSLKSSSKQTA